MLIESIVVPNKISTQSVRITLNLGSKLMAGRILCKISSFETQMMNVWTKGQRHEFRKLISKICQWLELHEDQLKGHVSESVAQVMLFLVCGKLGISKKDFVQNLKPNVKAKRNLPKIENIKKLHCYGLLKKVFRENVGV